jgi:CubicO group peptidase (beta-lactamase class C family)
MATYMADQPLQFTPGTQAVYSNFGYSLLGQSIEKLTGLKYERALEQHIYRPLGLNRPRQGQSLLSQRAPGEVRYHGRYPYVSPSVMSPDQPLVPAAYGGSNEQLADSLGGQIMAACDYAKLLASFDLGQANPLLHPVTVATMWAEPAELAGSNILRGWFKGILPNGMTAIGHNGDEAGTTTMVFRRSDDTSFVVFFNHDFDTSLYIDGTGNELSRVLSNAADAISAWPAIDLFPTVGIPGFPREGA